MDLQSDFIKYQLKAQYFYQLFQPECVAVYLGGSRVNPFIKNPKDIDFIIFTEKNKDIGSLRARIHREYIRTAKELDPLEDVVQVRSYEKEEHSYGSYINQFMILLCGTPHTFTFDILERDRNEYISILKTTCEKIEQGKIKNPKRWYQLLNGYYFLKNNSYTLNEKQILEINILHDLSVGYELLINQCKKYIRRL